MVVMYMAVHRGFCVLGSVCILSRADTLQVCMMAASA